jgi:thioesterase domain-containing protein/SAM-dependent methyltransferase/acyl carrier protein
VAYVVPADGAAESEAAEVVDRWREVWDEAYARSDTPPNAGDAPAAEPGFNTAGWVSSYDLQPIPAAEMREWLERTVERMLADRPRRILDVGCGTGLYLFRMAPHCESYVGVDAAAEALRAIERDPAYAALHNVTLRQALAHELGDRLAPASFDLVVLNSVVQYFPTVDYLVDVMEQAARLVAPGGTLFVGDVRALSLLETFHTSVALAQAPDDASTAELRARVRHRLSHEQELVVDPALFHAVAARLTGVREVRVMPKRGTAENELTKFRYDVALRFAGAADHGTATNGHAPAPPPERTVADLETARALLAQRPPLVRLVDIADRRLQPDLRALALLGAVDAPPTVGALRAALAAAAEQSEGVDLEALRTLDPDYDVEPRWPASGRAGHVDVLLRHRRTGPAHLPTDVPRHDAPPDAPWSSFVYHAVPDAFEPARVAAWRAALAERLPEYMVPSAFVRLTALPLTPNGKVDRKALPAPAAVRHTGAVQAPRDPLERQIAEMFEQVLGVAPISATDNFFDIGGHSMLALRLVARIEGALGRPLPLGVLFQSPTVRGLAAALGAGAGVSQWSSLVPIQAGTDRPPFFCVHAIGGHVMNLRDILRRLPPEQPVFALQARGLNGDAEPARTFEEMAAHYIAEMRSAQPRGPYFIGGLSLGGVIAFEMARQLEAAGDAVALVALLDAHLHPRFLPRALRIPYKALKLWRYATLLVTGSLSDQRSYLYGVAGNVVRRARARWAARRAGSGALRDGGATSLAEIQGVIWLAFERYVPKPYGGRLTLLRAAQRHPDIPSDPAYEWPAWTRDGVDVVNVPGDHLSMFELPNVDVLAGRLSACLTEAQRRHGW